MSTNQIEERLDALNMQIELLKKESTPIAQELMMQLLQDEQKLSALAVEHLTASDRVAIARNSARPTVVDYINALCTNFISFAGDRRQGDDESILGGIAYYHGVPVTVIGHRKGKTLEENIRFNFGMSNPEGYRKAERLMLQAQKFGRPIITFIDSPGAYPGLEAEKRGQGEAIAHCLAVMSNLSVPIISIVIGEGGSGGALAIAVADKLLMLENAIFAILSPEGFASILWKDSSRWKEAAEVMKLTAKDLKQFGIVDDIIPEPPCGAHRNPQQVFESIDQVLYPHFKALTSLNSTTLLKNRYQKIRVIGSTGKEIP